MYVRACMFTHTHIIPIIVEGKHWYQMTEKNVKSHCNITVKRSKAYNQKPILKNKTARDHNTY